MAGIGGDVARAVAHLRKASASVDRLWRATEADRADEAVIGLGEASLAIHRALVALAEWDGVGADGPGQGPRDQSPDPVMGASSLS